MVSDSVIRWRLRLRSSLEEVFRLLVTDDGRGRFWARTKQTGDAIDFHFPNGYRCRESILRCDALRRFELTYFGGRAVFELDSSDGATVLSLSHHDVAQCDWI
ncbi:MAG: hypothetical protein KC729_20170 [Candidatus Eisenbacteria bacterium]|uniref:Uncharacterized protein n=1 Tax=Eiseniibacteriota bacterium TaxID=2212470 RepID=A0A956M535_UNCEI|nr:hypothetical protein [Candidatus Eisenbacteria bacterium]